MTTNPEHILHPTPLILGFGWVLGVLTITPSEGSEIRLAIKDLRKNHQLQFLKDSELQACFHGEEGYLSWYNNEEEVINIDWQGLEKLTLK